MNTPYIINYSNSVSCFPAIEIITGAVKIQANSLRLSITGNAKDLLTIQSGWYLLCDTGDETSEIRKITGINRINRKLVIETPFTVVPTDTVIRVATVQETGTICIFNSGAQVMYVGGQELAVGQKMIWGNTKGEAPIVIYGAGAYQVSNGIITDNSGGSGGDSNNYFPSL